ncbi:hypothetical protein [Bradyrhizobium sp. SEMIA]|uniref:hypothetical protein n=1 Tax=Bradyrhizobium sp. SEMIA TaxID=2597515 RepID=UPI0018A5BEC1|nr:hypothetical protein [Bradyrhizobium sp. SEMIA]QOG17768.1 hypothetical protein FOM02_10850 [Bradyrhizobium sp. SEMIA]
MGMNADDKFNEKEAQERFEAALRGALKTPHEPLKEKPKVRAEKPAKKKPGK